MFAAPCCGPMHMAHPAVCCPAQRAEKAGPPRIGAVPPPRLCAPHAATAGLRQRVEASLGGPLDEAPQLHIVRDVAPKKLMVEVTFRVPPSIAFAASAANESAKRQRVE